MSCCWTWLTTWVKNEEKKEGDLNESLLNIGVDDAVAPAAAPMKRDLPSIEEVEATASETGSETEAGSDAGSDVSFRSMSSESDLDLGSETESEVSASEADASEADASEADASEADASDAYASDADSSAMTALEYIQALDDFDYSDEVFEDSE